MIVFNDPLLARYVVDRAWVADFDPRRDPSICSVGDRGLMGGVIFQDCTGARGSICLHGAGWLPGWLNRAVLWHTFHFAFNTVGVKKIIGKVPANNYKSLKLALHLGFTVETAIKDVFPDDDLFIMSMYRDACKWLSLPRPNTLVRDGTPNVVVRKNNT